jgi:hypothetical protein
MANNFYPCTSISDLTGASLQLLHGTEVFDNDSAMVATEEGYVYFYRLDATSGAAESIPDIVAPLGTPGDKRWILLYSIKLSLQDLSKDYHTAIVSGDTLTANRILTLIIGDAARQITLSGNPTLADWFDQSVKTTASPTFANITDSGLTVSLPVFTDGDKKLVSKSIADTLLALNVEAGADVTDATNVNAAGAVMESDYNVHSILAATADDTPAALTVGEQTVVGRLSGENISAVTIGIADNNIVQIDSADAATGEYAKFTANGLQSKSLSETAADIKDQFPQAITDNHVVTVDQDGAADNDFAKFTANGLEGRSYTEVKQDLDLEIGIDVAAQTHASQHAVGGADTILPADPGADKFLMWDDDPGVLVWADASGGGGDVATDTIWDAAGDLAVGTGANTAAKVNIGAEEVVARIGAGNIDGITMAEQTVLGRLTGGSIDDVAIGIADNNIVQIDSADAATGEYAKFTANGLESKSLAEVRADLLVAPGTIGGTTPGIVYATMKEIYKTASADSPLTALQVSRTIVSNYGMTDADCVISLPTAAEGYTFICILPAVRAKYFKFRADTNDKIYLSGVAGSNNAYVGVASGYATADSAQFFTFKASDGGFDWYCIPIKGTWLAS